MNATQKTYVIHKRNVKDIENFIVHLSQIRILLTVQFENVEEEILKNALWLQPFLTHGLKFYEQFCVLSLGT